jgi:hypothetical protein
VTVSDQYTEERELRPSSDRDGTRERASKIFALLFIFTVPYGYFGINLIRSNTNPLSMYLLPIFLFLIMAGISKVWNIELILGVFIGILCLSTLNSLFNPFNGLQAIIRIAGYCVGFSYFVIAIRGFHCDLDTEYWITIAYLPILLYGLFETFVVVTGIFTKFISLFRSSFVSLPAITPSRVSLVASEPSFIAFQIPLLLYVFHKRKRYVYLFAFLIIIVFTDSLNCYLTTVIFYISFITYKILTESISLKWNTIGIGSFSILFIYLNRIRLYRIIISIIQDPSSLERLYYIVSLIYMIREFPFGVGVGQYGAHALRIFRQYDIPITRPAVVSNLRSGTLDPWSFILGIVVEGGIIVIPVVILLFSKLFHISKINIYSFAAFVPSLFLLFQTYPPATPYIWILFGLICHENIS